MGGKCSMMIPLMRAGIFTSYFHFIYLLIIAVTCCCCYQTTSHISIALIPAGICTFYVCTHSYFSIVLMSSHMFVCRKDKRAWNMKSTPRLVVKLLLTNQIPVWKIKTNWNEPPDWMHVSRESNMQTFS